MYKIITCDLDETLLDSNHQIPTRVKAAVAAARERGVRFVPASGRGFTTMQGTLEELGLRDLPGEYTISFNSGAITENRGNRIMYLQGISWDFANQVLLRGLALGDVCVHVYTTDVVWAWNVPQAEWDYIGSRMNMVRTTEPNLDFLRGQQIVKCLLMNLDQDYLHRIARDSQDITADIDVSYSSNRYLEFNARGVNKGAGLMRLADMLGVPREQTIAIGDNYNDLSMVEAAGLGVLMANAPEELKPRADYVTHDDNDAGGVAEVIEKFVLGA